ncbi:type II toxin-antitoxin system RelE/ParE family toxin [Flavobacterium sufflavum]|uniref:Type II toxin-antitoxin system RelE/ParE family toxin n=1 Tax=Flavobacterium sufflavum TaxID=1921138 RepID=A0A3S2XKY9_9FLAO|nr:type II toxin-antitoxin system RelE/ParE family toxin [Flavobacterium sufflavum]RVT78558.1 type II toxin-antitoxin system RelE/ParE family toxin [Flavobacterium sufflavum]
MKYTLEIKEEAVLDIKEAYLYYEERKIGLGNRFLDTLEIYLERVQQYPEHYQIRRKPYREAFIKDFPYLIIYEIEGNKVIVYAVFNTWRNPNKKPVKK